MTQQTSWIDQFHTAKVCLSNFEFAKSISIFEELIATSKPEMPYKAILSAHRRIADAYFSLGNLDKALSHSHWVTTLSKQPLERDYIRKARILDLLKEYQNGRETLVRFGSFYCRINAPEAASDNIIVAALPKSGSTSIAHSIAELSNKKYIEFPNRQGNTFFSNSEPVYKCYTQIQGLGCVLHSHLLPKERFVELIKSVPKFHIILHMRDPREALISVLDMIHRGNAHHIIMHNPNLLTKSVEEQLDWMIEEYLPFQLDWISKWMRIKDNFSDLNISLSTFTDLKECGQTDAAKTQLQKIGVDFEYKDTPKMRFKQRILKGRWCDLTTPKQRQKADEEIDKRHLASLIQEM